MRDIILLDKPIGQTPLQTIDIFRSKNPEYKKMKLGYAGRLDPMAEGLLLILVGEENKKRKEYEAFRKTYEFEMLIGIGTDTYDILGLITKTSIRPPEYVDQKIKEILKEYIGKRQQPYPPYSSQPVNGKPLFYWARENKLADIIIPKKEIEIYDLTFLSSTLITSEKLRSHILTTIPKVHGEFRQAVIIDTWNNFFIKNTHKLFPVIKLRIACSSGTYVRSLIHTLGRKLQTHAIALRIRRISVGTYTLKQ